MEKPSSFLLTIVLCTSLIGCITSKRLMHQQTTLSATEILPYGRYAHANHQLELISSAAHFGFSFRGRTCQVFASIPAENDHNYLQYEIDGKYQGKLRVTVRDSLPIIITAKGNGRHTVWIYKATEAHTGPIFINKIVGAKVKALEQSAAPWIEFIGNSITCGAAADDSEVPCGTGVYHDQHNAYDAYGPRVARELGVNYLLSSVSGIGIYRNWNSDGPTLPQVYDKIDFQKDSSREWDFKTTPPAIVSIAMGTNDFSGGDGITPRLPFDELAFTAKYIAFVQQVKAHYPAAQIVLLDSPILKGEQKDTLVRCLSAVKTSIDVLYPLDLPVRIHLFTPMQARGCTGHPSVADHALLAEELLPFFKQCLPEY